jgi:hypothetical protein
MGRWVHVVLVPIVVCTACDGGRANLRNVEVAPVPRRTVVWLTDEGIDVDAATRLAEVGVDELVVRRGSILLSDSAPVVQLRQAPPVDGPIPVAIALEVKGLSADVPEGAADAVWAGLAADFGDRLPAELILDLPVLGERAPDFVARLARVSGLAVVPILSLSQIEQPLGGDVAKAAHGCIVPVFGAQSADLRGVGGQATQSLADKLASIAGLGVRVRVGIALRPKTDPPVRDWAQDVDLLTDDRNASIMRTSTLDRSFVAKRSFDWAGQSWSTGETIAVAWVDTPRLSSFLVDCHRLVLPEAVGWDLVTLPPIGSNLGLGREELIRFLDGKGPAPELDAEIQRSGRNLTVELINQGIFRSTITGFGNWLQVELESGMVVASSRGAFDRIILGSTTTGDWRPNPEGQPNAVRFLETYVAPGETLKTGTIRLPSSRSRVTVRWHVQLSDGSVVEGVLE